MKILNVAKKTYRLLHISLKLLSLELQKLRIRHSSESSVKASQEGPWAIFRQATSWPVRLIFAHY